MEKRKSILNNNGVALVTVMVLTTVCMLMATIIVEITYSSLLSRRVNTKSDNNFYSAETTVDNLEAIVQSIAIQATADMNTASKTFVNAAASRVITASGAEDLDDTTAVSRYMFNQLQPSLQRVLGKVKKDEEDNIVTDAEGNTVYEYDDSKFRVSAIKTKVGTGTEKSSLTFSISFSYQDPETGYLNDISTDLVMHDVTTRTPPGSYGYGSYSMFTGGGGHFYGNNNPASNHKMTAFLQEGNAYYGSKEGSDESVDVYQCGLVFDSEKVVINGDMYVTGNSAVIFKGKKLKKGNYVNPEIDIRGTLYIDGSSVVVIGEGCNFICNDIVFTDTGKSFWKTNYTESKYKDSYELNGFYPFTYDSIEELRAAGSGDGELHENFYNSVTTGCLIYRKDSDAWVLGYDTANKKYTLNSSTTLATQQLGDTLINHSDTLMPYAKTAVEVYDGSVITVDSELAKFANINVMYLKSKTGNSLVAEHDVQLMNDVDLDSGTVEELPSVKGGAPFKIVVYRDKDDNYLEYDKFSHATYNNSTASYYTGVIGTSSLLAGNIPIQLVTSSFDAPLNNGSFALYSRFGEYTIHGQGGEKNVGMFVSTDCVDFMAQGTGTFIVYSLIDAKSIDNATKTDVEKIARRIALSSMMFNQVSDKPINDTANNFTGFGFSQDQAKYYSYALLSINSNYLTGIESLLAEDGEQNEGNGGKVTVSLTNMYDFVSVENWRQD